MDVESIILCVVACIVADYLQFPSRDLQGDGLPYLELFLVIDVDYSLISRLRRLALLYLDGVCRKIEIPDLTALDIVLFLFFAGKRSIVIVDIIGIVSMYMAWL